MEGNQMKVRETLERIYMQIISINCMDIVQKKSIDKCRMLIKQALSAPARNCDLYDNWHDAHQAWECLPKDELGYFVAANGVHECEQAWLFAPAEERKGEGDA